MNLDLIIVLKTEKYKDIKNKRVPKVRINEKNYFNKFLYYVSKFNFKSILIFYDKNSINIDKKYNGKIINFIKIICHKINDHDPKEIGNFISNKVNKKSILINTKFIKNFEKNISITKKIFDIKSQKLRNNDYFILNKNKNYDIYKNFRNLKKFLLSKNEDLNFISNKNTRLKEKLEKAVFLDRDGVINYDMGYIHKWSQFKFRPGVIRGLKNIIKNNYLIFIITNQSGIGRGYFNEKQFFNLHQNLKTFLAKKKIFINETKYCPYHPKAKIKKFRKKTQLRKPGNLMIKNILKSFSININKSFMIGDNQSDEIAAKKSDLKFFYSKNNFFKQIKEINMLINKMN
jgi:D-glycero-D-manno-heptose 1,7-bisphosphate phosphatase